MTSHGFNLTGFPALLPLAVIVAYFVLGKRVAGGTVETHSRDSSLMVKI